MPGYRLTFGTQHVMANTLPDTMIAADDVLGEVISTLAERAEILGHDYFLQIGVAQFSVRFEAADDQTAYVAAQCALQGLRVPFDNVKMERRSRRYVPIEV